MVRKASKLPFYKNTNLLQQALVYAVVIIVGAFILTVALDYYQSSKYNQPADSAGDAQ